MNTTHLSRIAFLLSLAGAAAILDFIIRFSSSAWTTHSIAQIAVTLSPLVYTGVIVSLMLHVRRYPPKLSESTHRGVAGALCIYSILIMSQVFTRHHSVGSASYSDVSPIFVSGLPAGILTFIVFFRKPRHIFFSIIIATATVLWVLCPLAIDTMYLQQGGYRGNIWIHELAVVGTTYQLLTAIVVIGAFASLLIIPAILVIAPFAIYRSQSWCKMQTIAMVLSLLAFCVQLHNWGGFVMD